MNELSIRETLAALRGSLIVAREVADVQCNVALDRIDEMMSSEQLFQSFEILKR